MQEFINTIFSKQFSFQNPEFLWLLVLVPLVAVWQWRRERSGKSAAVVYSGLEQMKSVKQRGFKSLRHSVTVFRLLALALLVIAFARPRLENQKQTIYSEGVDMVLVIDLSGSMQAEDFDPKNRIEAAKSVAEEFVRNRVSDRIGLVVFAGKSYTQCPPTLDYELIINLIESLEAGRMDEDGTAIGLAIATATNRLRSSTAKSKIVILLTDGQNNAGEIEPLTAAELAAAIGVKIYTVGAGTRGYANFPYTDQFGLKHYLKAKVDVDDSTLTKIAKMTGGRYFRATDFESLKQTYSEIDRLEKTKVEVQNYTEYKEEFAAFLTPALLLLAIELILANTRFRKLP